MRTLTPIAVAVCCVAAGWSVPAAAQMWANFAGDMALNRQLLAPVAALGARNAAVRRRGGAAGAASMTGGPSQAPLPGVSTSYRADPATAERGRRQFADRVRKISGQKAGDAIGRLLASQDLRQAWAAQAAPDGMRPGDVADAMAEYFVVNWQIAHAAADPGPAAIQAVRDGVRAAMLRQARFAALSDPQKQDMAEAFMYDTLLEAEAYKGAVTRGDQAGAHSLQQASVDRFRRELGIDLRRLRLTDRGFTEAM